jgi:ppGpp synthetase/RelA/SpoT-type nucleotidyltranferase
MNDTERVDRILREYDRDLSRFDRFRSEIERLLKELMRASEIRTNSVASRVKDRLSFEHKVKGDPKYETARSVTDFAGARIITYFAEDVDHVANVIRNPDNFEIDVRNSVDKRRALPSNQFGYQSLHLVAALSKRRLFMENREFEGLKIEIQIRSLLQHTWAEIEHVYYKSERGLPPSIRRRVSILAGVLELTDNEFVAVRKDAAALTMELPICRAEGLTELVSDFSIDIPLGALLAESDLRNKGLILYANTNITSRMVGNGGATEVEVYVEEANSGGRVLKGSMCSASAIFFGDIFPAIPTSGEYIRVRISGLRVNAFQLGLGATWMPTTIHASVALGQRKESGMEISEPITGPVDVARIKPAVNFKVHGIKQLPLRLVDNQTNESRRVVAIQVSYHTLFSNAFRQANEERSSAEMLPAQGTRLMLRVACIPVGGRCFASVRDTPLTKKPSFCLTRADVNGSGPFDPLEASDKIIIDHDNIEIELAEITIVGTTVVAVWECIAPQDSDRPLLFNIVLDLPRTFSGGINLYGSLAPLSNVGTTSSTDPVPRFADTSTPITVLVDELREVLAPDKTSRLVH